MSKRIPLLILTVGLISVILGATIAWFHDMEVSRDNVFQAGTWIHDIAILSVTPFFDEVGAGQPLNITVVVKNEGDVVETFNITAKYDNSTIGTQEVKDLAPYTSKTLTFTWNTTNVTPCINYTIKAEADVVPGETDITYNIFIDGTVHIRILSDIRGPDEPDHPPDGVVDMWDFGFIGLAYGKTSADPDWDLYKIADTRGPESPEGSGLYPPDGKVDMWDFGYCGLQYGETC